MERDQFVQSAHHTVTSTDHIFKRGLLSFRPRFRYLASRRSVGRHVTLAVRAVACSVNVDRYTTISLQRSWLSNRASLLIAQIIRRYA